MISTPLQTTIRHPIMCRGIGLHTGNECTLELHPSDANTGILFESLDHPQLGTFKLHIDRLYEGMLATRVVHPDNKAVQFSTIEHLLAALHAFNIDNILIKVGGGEVPILDGTASPFIFLLQSAGSKTLPIPRKRIRILKPIKVKGKSGEWAEILPLNDDRGENLQIKLTIDFPDCLIKKQYLDITLNKDGFIREVGQARTFVEKKHIEALRSQGLTLGGSLKNALVIDGKKLLNPEGFKQSDECVRHKAMDVIGDLYCLGTPIIGSFTGYKTGHKLNHQLLHALLKDKNAWEYIKD